jgi:ComF family protein
VTLLTRLASALLDLALPPRCLGCGARDAWVCPGCAAGLPRLPAARCRVCAAPLTGTLICPTCYRDRPHFDAVYAPFRHDGLARELVHALKYRGHRHLAVPLAQAAAAVVDRPGYDLVVPVPLHPSRLARRGFNQSELLARAVAATLELPLAAGALERVRSTEPQTEMPRPAARVANVRGAFRATAGLRGLDVLLVDDVCTTGATVDACAAALRRAGAARLDVLVVTRAVTQL